MLKRNWFNGFTFGLIFGLLLTPVSILIAVALGISPSDFSQTDSQPNGSEQKSPQDARWWLIRSVVYMDDTAAQWIMMFATIFAAYLLLRTLLSTQDIVKDTREIGEAQARAYPFVTSVSVVGVTNGLPRFVVAIENAGNSPALSLNCRGHVMLSWQEDCEAEGMREQLSISIEATGSHQITVAPNSTQKAEIHVPYGEGAENNGVGTDMKSGVIRKNPVWMVNFFFDWTDVFGRDHTFYINARQRPTGREDVSAMAVVSAPFEISYQSASTERESS